MAKTIIKATKSTPFMVVMGLVIVAAVGFVLVPNLTKAGVGTMIFQGVNGSGSGPYDAYGTWQPVGNQPCYNKGNGFRYFIEVFNDLGNNGSYDASDPILQVISPAACDGVFDGTPSSNLTEGGDWPAVGQNPLPATFNLTESENNLCAVLKHVTPTGNDIVDTDCLSNPIYLDQYIPVTITKTDNKEVALAGDTSTYEITVHNDNEISAFGVMVTDTVPTEITNVTNISDSGALNAGVITWTIDLAADESKTLSYQGTVDPDLPVGTSIMVNTAELGCGQQTQRCLYQGTAIDTTSVTVEEPAICGDNEIQTPNDDEVNEECDDGQSGSPTCSTKCTIIEPEPEPEPTAEVVKTAALAILKNVDQTSASPGDTLTYTIVVSNSGEGDATDVILSDTLPAGLTYLDSQGTNTGDTTKAWTWDTLASGDDVTVTYQAIVDSHAGVDTYVNTASVEADGLDPVQDEASTDVRILQVLGDEAPALTITKSVNKTFANPGDTVTYTVTVKNTGDAPAMNAVLTDVLPAGFVYLGTNKTTTSWNLGDIVPTETVKKTYQATIDTSAIAGKYVNTATVKADDVNPVSAKATLEVREVQVLGAEEQLPVTGPQLMHFLYLAGAGLLAGFSLIVLKLTSSKS